VLVAVRVLAALFGVGSAGGGAVEADVVRVDRQQRAGVMDALLIVLVVVVVVVVVVVAARVVMLLVLVVLVSISMVVEFHRVGGWGRQRGRQDVRCPPTEDRK